MDFSDLVPADPLADPVPFSPAREAARLFRLAADGSQSLPAVIAGLREVVVSASNFDLFRCDVADLKELREAIAMAQAPALAAVHRLAPERVALGLGAASGLVGDAILRPEHRDDVALVLDRIDHTALLSAELDADLRRRRIEGRGDVLRRSIRIAVARDTPATGQLIQ